MNSDTPLPPDEPAGENPPDGAIIDYYLSEKTNAVITIDIEDAAGNIIRHYSSADTLYAVPAVNIPLYWVRPQQLLSGAAGAHRFVWDLHYQPINQPPAYSMGAIFENTPPAPTGPWVMPGIYNVLLTINGKTYTEPLKVVMDPRVKTTYADLQLQHTLSLRAYTEKVKCLKTIDDLNKRILELTTARAAYDATDQKKLDELLVLAGQLISGNESFTALSNNLSTVMGHLQGGDLRPTSQCIAAADKCHENYLKYNSLYRSVVAGIAELSPKPNHHK
jgi:hypothetical protein